jgi:FKBP-type peptidyl-prolyl cis-trans isomerase
MKERVPREVAVSNGSKLARIVAAVLVAALAVFALAACSSESDEAAEETTNAEEAVPEESAPVSVESSWTTFPVDEATELVVEDLVVGTGSEATTGSPVLVHYTGYLVDGTMFDSSVERGEPFDFVLSQGMVIRGWDEGVAGMKVGGVRRLVIPPDMGYGSQGAGFIPPNATLVFEVELLEVQ